MDDENEEVKKTRQESIETLDRATEAASNHDTGKLPGLDSIRKAAETLLGPNNRRNPVDKIETKADGSKEMTTDVLDQLANDCKEVSDEAKAIDASKQQKKRLMEETAGSDPIPTSTRRL